MINIAEDSHYEHGEYYFITPWGWGGGMLPYLIIMDSKGVPVFYRQSDASHRDLKVQKNGYLSYGIMEDGGQKFILLDSSYNRIDTFQVGNGYTFTDTHDFQLLERQF